MNKLLGIMFLVLANFVWAEEMPPRCLDGDLNKNAPAETEEFGFLVGDFAVTLHAWTPTGWSPARPVKARWNGWYGLEGMAIVDEWFDPDPHVDPSGGRGINVRLYDAEENLWKMMWIHTQTRVVTDLRAKKVDGVLTMWQVQPERPNFKAEFEVINEDKWARVSYIPADETGAEKDQWVPQFKLEATRIPCSE